MSGQTLKEKLKPPFQWNLIGLIKLSDNVKLQLCTDDLTSPTVDYLHFVCAALDEKYERVFHEEEPTSKINPHVHCPQCRYPIYKSDFDTDEDGEPLRWIPKENKKDKMLKYNVCPKCDTTVTSTDIWNFCPHCGQKLKPPEENKNE